ncbi:unnamed protein product [Ceutorhynchus assimilis]|uniref:Uncharacterized protein n=1 Tax=Ceutorhynchus assimilis TaxID=467358 RepID=A0A9N9MPQ6_9CUCU|nr:unnamed protein product [Ceutorhynchus assimilis]
MAEEPEALYEEWPVMGDAGECVHYYTAGPAITRNCNRVKDAIKKKRKYILQVMMDPASKTNVHSLNENIRNLDWLWITWESLHYNPPYRWNRTWLINLTPNAYRIFKKKSMAVHWKNQNYNLDSLVQFPPLTETNILLTPNNEMNYKIALIKSNNCNAISLETNNIVFNSNYESDDSENEDIIHNYESLLEKSKVLASDETSHWQDFAFSKNNISWLDAQDDTDTETVCDPEEYVH